MELLDQDARSLQRAVTQHGSVTLRIVRGSENVAWQMLSPDGSVLDDAFGNSSYLPELMNFYTQTLLQGGVATFRVNGLISYQGTVLSADPYELQLSRATGLEERRLTQRIRAITSALDHKFQSQGAEVTPDTSIEPGMLIKNPDAHHPGIWLVRWASFGPDAKAALFPLNKSSAPLGTIAEYVISISQITPTARYLLHRAVGWRFWRLTLLPSGWVEAILDARHATGATVTVLLDAPVETADDDIKAKQRGGLVALLWEGTTAHTVRIVSPDNLKAVRKNQRSASEESAGLEEDGAGMARLAPAKGLVATIPATLYYTGPELEAPLIEMLTAAERAGDPEGVQADMFSVEHVNNLPTPPSRRSIVVVTREAENAWRAAFQHRIHQYETVTVVYHEGMTLRQVLQAAFHDLKISVPDTGRLLLERAPDGQLNIYL